MDKSCSHMNSLNVSYIKLKDNRSKPMSSNYNIVLIIVIDKIGLMNNQR
jgi:hypothetical protein